MRSIRSPFGVPRSSPLRATLVAVAVLAAPAACRKPAPPGSARPAQGPEPARIVVTAARQDLVFTWIDAAGAFHDTTALAEIPPEARAQVLVRDLSRTPEELHSAEYLYVADLRSPDDSGRFPCGAVSRRAFDRQGAADVAAKVAQEQGGAPVTVYTTAWCGVCRRAKEFLKQRGVAFAERDVEKDSGADGELQARAAAAGVRPQGVPVIDVMGELMLGFDPDALAALLARKGLARSP